MHRLETIAFGQSARVRELMERHLWSQNAAAAFITSEESAANQRSAAPENSRSASAGIASGAGELHTAGVSAGASGLTAAQKKRRAECKAEAEIRRQRKRMGDGASASASRH